MNTTSIDSLALRYAGASAVSDRPAQPAVDLTGAASASAAQALQKPSTEQVKEVAQALNTYMDERRSDLRFRLDDDSGQIVVSVVDNVSGEVLRQIPSEAVLRVARQITELGWGLAEERV